MKTKRFIKIDLYILCDIMLMLSVVFFFTKKIDLQFTSIAIIILGVFGFFQATFGQTSVKNNSNKPIKVKLENKDLINVEPQTKASQIEGIKIENKVYKIPNNVHVSITKNNKICIYSFSGYLVYKVRGGKQKQVPNSSWNKLFEA